jgi:hypothetical protein
VNPAGNSLLRPTRSDENSRLEEDPRPGRTCPTAYRYSPRVFDREPQLVAETVFVVGGLYGNMEALEALTALAARESGPCTFVFNGDFHWFDVSPADFAHITRNVLLHPALRGNVETEIAAEDSGAGCGCAYPADVSDADVSRSNEILERLRATARGFPEMRERLAALPMHLTARVGEARIGIVHGDAASLAGWGFAHGHLDNPRHRRWIESAFRDAKVDVFASSHTCLPALRSFDLAQGTAAVINNGAAGMPNFTGTGFGVVTRISTRAPGGETLYGMKLRDVFVDAVALHLDVPRWTARFLDSWPEGTAAHASYFRRITGGPRFSVSQARPLAA